MIALLSRPAASPGPCLAVAGPGCPSPLPVPALHVQGPGMVPRRAYTDTRVHVHARRRALYTSGGYMSNGTRQGMVTERPRRPRKSERQTWEWVRRITEAKTGAEAATAAMQWTWSVLSDIEEHHSKAADAARWQIARELAAVAAGLRRAQYEHRAGLTAAEQQALLGRAAPQGGDTR
jgi:hypothetical protein